MMLLNPFRFAADVGISGMQFIGKTDPVPSSTSSLSMAIPAGTLAGDMLVVIICRQPNAQTITTSDGWAVDVNYDAGGGIDRRFYVAHKIAGPSEPAAVFSFSGSGQTGGALLVYRGASTVTAGSVSSTLTAAEITMPTDGILIAAFYAYAGGSPATISATPDGMTQRAYPLLPYFVYMPIFDQSAAPGPTGSRGASITGGGVSSRLSVVLGIS